MTSTRKSRKMSEAQKRRRRYARDWGKTSREYIRRAIEHQKMVFWCAERRNPAEYADIAVTYQKLSDQCLDSARYWAKVAANWAHQSEEAL